MNLLESPTGYLSNLSASGVAGVVSEDGIDQPVAVDVVVEIPVSDPPKYSARGHVWAKQDGGSAGPE